MINTLLDIIKISEERITEKIIQLKNFKKNVEYDLDRILLLIRERLIFLIKTSDSQEDKYKIEDIVKCLLYSEK